MSAVLPLGRIRRITADRMASSARSVARVTLHADVDVTAAERRRGLGSDDGARPKPPWDAIFARAAGLALAEHPALLGEWVEGEGIRARTASDVGVAVAIGPNGSDGLVVPVLRDCAGRPVADLASDLRELAARARTRRLALADQEGGTFTITNLGMFRVDGFTPIVLPGQTAILGVGRIADRMAIVDGEPRVRRMTTLSLAFDHRVVDGAPAAAFFTRMAEILESDRDPSELWDAPSERYTASSM